MLVVSGHNLLARNPPVSSFQFPVSGEPIRVVRRQQDLLSRNPRTGHPRDTFPSFPLLSDYLEILVRGGGLWEELKSRFSREPRRRALPLNRRLMLSKSSSGCEVGT